jgi:hypothetical protein
MRILFISQYFPPEMGAPAARTYELARRWVEAGAEVTVVTAIPNHPTGVIPPEYRGQSHYDETVDGVRIIRTWTYATANRGFWKRSVNYVSFLGSSLLQGLRLAGPADVVLATSPQFLVGIAGSVASRMRNVPFVFEVRDLWPDSIAALGMLGDGLTMDFLRRLPGNPKAIAECLDAVMSAIPYCIDLLGGPYIWFKPNSIIAFRPKHAVIPPGIIIE